MKRVSPILLALVLVLSMLPTARLTASASSDDVAYPVEGGNIYFKPSTGTVVGCDETITSANIPAEINGVAVTAIGEHALAYCDALTTVTIPDSVTFIDYGALRFCANLTGVTLPKHITSIPEGMFEGCERLTSVTIPDGVTSIGYAAFSDCTSLTKATLPESVTEIDWYAFSSCTSLEDVSIPANVTSVGYAAFFNTAFENNNDNWLNDVLYLDNWLLRAEQSIYGEYAIAKNTRGIADQAFGNCTNLLGVVIPDSITCISQLAFYNCISLIYVTIPDSVTEICYAAFYDCHSLLDVTIPDSVTTLGYCAFKACAVLESATIGDGVTCIPAQAFAACPCLREVTFGDNVTVIEGMAFQGCTELTSVTIPATVTSIGDCAFYECMSLTDVYFLGDAPDIGEGVFKYADDYNGWQEVNIPGTTLYYLAGAKDWTSPTWNGYPTAVHTHSYENGICTACGAADANVKPSTPSDTFVDIPANAWYKSAVDYAVENGLMNGMGKGEFQPDEPTTRAMVVTILYRLSGSSSKYENKFSDVLNNNWYTDAISWAAFYGIVNGMTTTTFEPETSMTREMLAVILYRYTTKKTDADTSNKADLSRFPDVNSVSPWAKEALAWAVGNGIVNGVGDGKTTYLSPLGNATRAQVAAIFQRYIENVLK